MARILLIETDRLLANNFSKYLAKRGHQIIWEKDPQEAINIADQKMPDAIVVDLLLANRSGIEFLYEFRSYPEWQNLPVIIFSNVVADDFSNCLQAFEHLKISAYHYKLTTSLAQLAKTIDQSLKPILA